MFKRLRAQLKRLPLIELIGIELIIGLIISLVCLWAFTELAEEIVEEDVITRIDIEIANELHNQATPLSIEFYRVLSWIGMPGLWVIGVAVGVLFIVRRQWLHLGVWVIALAGGLLINHLLKIDFQRLRPVFTDPFAIEQTFSFPSGHAMMALIGFGLFAYFAVEAVKSSVLRILIVFAAVLLTLLIGISRMTLGVHYLSDVLAGFAAGGVLLAACITALDTIRRRKRMGDPAAQEATGIKADAKA